MYPVALSCLTPCPPWCYCFIPSAFVWAAASVMGKAEGRKELWHGHVTAVTVAPEYRRLGVAKQLMDSLEMVRDEGCRLVERRAPKF